MANKKIPEETRLIFERLCDEESKVIYRNMLEHYSDGDIRHFFNREYSYDDNRVATRKDINTIDEFIFNYSSSDMPVVIFGTGIVAKHTYRILEKLSIPVICFCEEEKKKVSQTNYLGLPVISIEELVNQYKNVTVFISADYKALKEIRFLIKHGFADEQIKIQHKTERPYFGQPFLKPKQDEIFIDAGGYDGDSIIEFGEWCDRKYKKIYSFEPDHGNFVKLQKNVSLNKFNNVILLEEGLWSSRTNLCFKSTGDMGSSIDNEGNSFVSVNTIDEYAGSESVTFIKMDIEGTELEALKGAKKTILSNKPRLAISIYHKPEDIIEIPLYINKLVPEYKFYIRQHTWEITDTVLYAIY